MTSKFGAMLQHHREQLGWTQEMLASQAELSTDAVSALERGTRRFPQRQTIERLVDALGLTGAELEEFTALVPRAVRRRNREDPNEFHDRGRPSTPRQLPAAATHFTGRSEQLRQLIDLLAEPSSRQAPVIAAITGMGGVGKTALAVQAAHALSEQYPDGQLYLDLRGYGPDDPMSSIDALGYLLRALGTPNDEIPVEVPEAAARFRSAVAARRMLIVLDNARDSAHVEPMVPGTPGSAVMVTSRRLLTALPNTRTFRLRSLEVTDGVQMLRTLAGSDRVDADGAGATEVVRLCGSLPLALRMAGARLAVRPEWSIADLVRRLSNEQGRLDELERDDVGVRTSLAVSIDQLAESSDAADRSAAETFVYLGIPDGPDISLALAARLIDASQRETEARLERLVDLNLLESRAPGRYRLHDLLRVYARERAVRTIPPTERAAALTRMIRLYAAVAWRACELAQPAGSRLSWRADRRPKDGPPFSDPLDALAWLDNERAHLIPAARQAAGAYGVDSELCVELAIGIVSYYLARHLWADWARVVRFALQVAERGNDRTATALLQIDLGYALTQLAEAGSGDYDTALEHFWRGLAEFRAAGDREREPLCLINVCHALVLAGRAEEAVEHGEHGLRLARELGNLNAQAVACTNLGAAYGRLGDRDRQLARLRESLQLAEQVGSDPIRAEVHRQLAIAYDAAGQHDQARAELQHGAQVFRRAGDFLGTAGLMDELGALELGLGNHEQALVDLRAALAIADQHDTDGRLTASIRHRLGMVQLELGDLDAATAHLTAALTIYERKNMAAAEQLRALVTDAL